MFTRKLRTAIVVAAGTLALAIPATALARNPVEWNYNPRDHRAGLPTQPLADVVYPLNDLGWPVIWGHGDCGPFYVGAVGVDLMAVPDSRPQAEWKFVRQLHHPRTTAITGTERVALWNSIGGYLIRADQTFGISLDFSQTPSYEWQVAAGYNGYDHHSSNIELYNTPEQAYLVANGVTNWCGDLAWLHAAPYSLPAGYQAPPTRRAIGIRR